MCITAICTNLHVALCPFLATAMDENIYACATTDAWPDHKVRTSCARSMDDPSPLLSIGFRHHIDVQYRMALTITGETEQLRPARTLTHMRVFDELSSHAVE
ncbi:hypothetical protein E4U55_004738 [Claviceps digitariae]|nr:hypothetical protein E4U55_004738 [Claviceps digitariae]